MGAMLANAWMLSMTLPALDLLHEFFEEAKGELFAGGVGHDEGAALGLRHLRDFAGQSLFHFRLGEVTGELAPERNVGRLGELEDFPGKDALRDEAGLFPEGELGRVEPFHETRKHFLHQAGARAELLREAVLDETRERIVEPVREGERRAAFAVRAAAACADVLEKIVRRLGRRRFREGGPTKMPP